MKLQANTGWAIVRRADPPTTAGGIILTGTAKPAKVDRGEVVTADDPQGRVITGAIVLFKGGEPFDHAGDRLVALKLEDVIGRELP